jgi:hypothetical protein
MQGSTSSSITLDASYGFYAIDLSERATALLSTLAGRWQARPETHAKQSRLMKHVRLSVTQGSFWQIADSIDGVVGDIIHV